MELGTTCMSVSVSSEVRRSTPFSKVMRSALAVGAGAGRRGGATASSRAELPFSVSSRSGWKRMRSTEPAAEEEESVVALTAGVGGGGGVADRGGVAVVAVPAPAPATPS